MNMLTQKIMRTCTRYAHSMIRRLNFAKDLMRTRTANVTPVNEALAVGLKCQALAIQSPTLPYIISSNSGLKSLYSKTKIKSSKFSYAFNFRCTKSLNARVILVVSGITIVVLCHSRVNDGFILQPVHALTPNISRHNFIADVVTKAGPAVVFLEIKGIHPESGKRITMSNGSGFLVRDNGLVLTSAHVVTNKSKVTVKLHSGEVFEGKVVAVDPVHDLAVAKIEGGKRFPIIPLGKSSTIRPGEFVVAMGSPLSLSNTVTSGIVSSSLRKSKELGLNNKDMQYIQTDAVISFGNSGGPLVNLDGKAIGINNLKVTTGISFAIPADYAISFIEETERLQEIARRNPSSVPSAKEATKRRYMGITMLSLTPPIVMELKDRLAEFPEVENGVYVHKVIVGSPAYEGGIHAGDIIVNINGLKIQSTADVYQAVDESDDLSITLIRGSNLRRLKVTTEQLF